MPARVVRVLVRAGQHVEKGAPIVQVIMPQLVTAAGAYVAAHTRLEAYQARRDQLAKLRAEGLAKAAEIAEVETRLAEAKADQQSALATLRAGGVDPGDANSLVEGGGTATLRSPVAGTVFELDATPGELRDPGGRPFARIAGEGAPRIQARIAHALPDTARFEFVTPAIGATPVRLLSRAPVVDPRDATQPAWFEPLVPTKLPRGQTGRLRAILDEKSGAVAVPAAAVGLLSARSFVTVRAGEGERRVDVEVLATSGADALVRSPRGELNVGDEVAAEARAAPSSTEGP
jgi:multidrug efflux pump subunit AcrA (membrane-fusion protein)